MSLRFRPLFVALSGAAALVLAGCPPQDIGPTGTTCPPEGTQLTAANFGMAFMTNYCTSCHSSQLSGPFKRHGAPDAFNFDTYEGVKKHAKDIDTWAGAGPENVNTEMPLGNPAPTEDERRQLSVWLACGAPQ